jgi:putative copper resistance protein D
MTPTVSSFQFRRRLPQIAIFLLFFLTLLVTLPYSARAQHSPDDHAGMSMPMDAPMDPAMQAKLLSDKHESEFNHHLAGFFVVLAGLFILVESWLSARVPTIRYVWPVCFLLSGIFVLIFSDTELWPFGPKPWLQGVVTNPEVIQHKTFAALLLALGLIELARAHHVLTALWAAWVFPVTAIAGSILLLFHSHDAGMHGPNHLVTMARIQTQHLSYSLTGLGIGVTKGLAEVRTRWQPRFTELCAALMVLLGLLLMIYVE